MAVILNKMDAILFFYHLKTDFQNVRNSNGFGIPMFGIQAPTVPDFSIFSWDDEDDMA